MSQHRSKKYLSALKQFDQFKLWEPQTALQQIAQTTVAQFDPTVEVSFNLRINPRRADEQIKGSLLLPSGHGKKVIVLALTKNFTTEAKDAGADYVGEQDFIDKIKQDDWQAFDVIVASPDVMGKVTQIARIIGPRGQMPNPKFDTVSQQLATRITEFKTQRIIFKNDKFGNLHLILGKLSLGYEKLWANYQAVIKIIKKKKPARVKGNFINSIHLATTMGPAWKIRVL